MVAKTYCIPIRKDIKGCKFYRVTEVTKIRTVNCQWMGSIESLSSKPYVEVFIAKVYAVQGEYVTPINNDHF